MVRKSAKKSGDSVERRGLRYSQDQLEHFLGEAEGYVRKNPRQSVAYALVAGVILNRLPILRIFGGFVRLLLMAFKPAILIYGATKLYQAAQNGDED